MDAFRDELLGESVQAVEFFHTTGGVAIMLSIGGADELDLAEVLETFSVESLRRDYARVLELERYKEGTANGSIPKVPANADAARNLRCPKCKANESVTIEVSECLTVYRDGTVTEGDQGQLWNSDSFCRCDQCGHEGVASEFHA